MLATHLAQDGCLADALAVSERAVDIYERLAAAQPAAFEPTLAKLLGSLSIAMARAGRCDDALKAGEHLLRVRRRLAAADPAAFEPYLWTALNNVADRLSECGRAEAADRVRAEATQRRTNCRDYLARAAAADRG